MSKLQRRLIATAIGMMLSASVLAQTGPVDLDIAPQPLSQALNSLARQSGAQIVFVSEVTAGKTAPAVKGKLTVREALDLLLKNSGLQIQASDARTFAVIPVGAAAANESVLPEVKVTAVPTDDLPPAYAGGQIARGARLGMLGNQDMMDTPFNVTSYTSQTMENQQARSLSDVLANDPSARAITPTGGLSDDFTIRGFVVASTDVALNGLFGLSPYYRVPVEVIDRVEVLKGPSALLTGMSPGGAVGGGVNVVTKRADDEPLTRVTANYVSDSQFGTHVDIGRRFGDEKQIGVRVNGVYRDGDTNIDHSSASLSAGSLGLDYRGERLRMSLDVISQHDDVDGTRRQPSFQAGVQIPSPPSNSVNWFPNAFSNQKDNTVMARADYDFTDNISGYVSAGTRRSRSELLLGNPSVNAQGIFQSQLAYWNSYTDTTSAEAGLRFRFDTGPVRHNVVLSSNVLDQKDGRILSPFSTAVPSSIYNPTTPNLPAAKPGRIPKVGDMRLSGIALADTMSFAEDKVLLTLGVRRQDISTKSYNATSGVVTPYDSDATTPMVGLVVKPWENVSLYANYIEGLSPGSEVTDINAANFGTVFAPYKSTQYETGIKFDLGRISTSVAFFQIDKPSLVSNAAAHIYTEAEQRNQGVEWSIFGEVTNNIRVLGGLAYTDGELTRTLGGVNQGNTAVGVPKLQANLGAEWDTPFVPNLTLMARAIYTSKQYVDAGNTQSIPDWTRYDIGARYQANIAGKNVMFRANIENLLDDNYWASLSSGGFVTLSAPRTFLLSATVDF